MQSRNRKTLVLIGSAILILMAGRGASAQERPPGAAPPDTVRAPSGVRWSLGLGVISAPRPYVGARNSTRLVPLLELYYKRVFVQGIRAGARLVQQGPVSLDAIVGPRFAGYEEGESSYLTGMDERKQSLDAGLALGWNRPRYGALLSVRRDLSGHSEGTQISFDVSMREAALGGRLRLQPALGIEWEDAATVDYYYGVRPAEARPGRPAYPGTSTLNYSASMLLLYGLTDHISLTSIVRLRLLGDEITSSPLVDRDLSYFGLAGLSYRF